jgi:hypothetical protein
MKTNNKDYFLYTAGAVDALYMQWVYNSYFFDTGSFSVAQCYSCIQQALNPYFLYKAGS